MPPLQRSRIIILASYNYLILAGRYLILAPMVYFLFVLGFIFLVRGAGYLVDGASVLAKKIGVSPLVIGLTVVAFGTSLPELIVNLFASRDGANDIVIGNIVGSNISNTMLILGVSALIHPLTIHRTVVYREIIFNIMATGVLAIMVADHWLGVDGTSGFGGLDRIDGMILMTFFVLFLYYTFGRSHSSLHTVADDATHHEKLDVPSTFLRIAGGAIGLMLGGQWIVGGATEIASLFGASETLIGLTVVALGTSLPELATSVVAVRKGEVDVAVGNAVGSNLFNILWALGLTAFISPVTFGDGQMFDVVVLAAVATVLFASVTIGKVRHQIDKPEGLVFVGIYVTYIIVAILRGFEVVSF